MSLLIRLLSTNLRLLLSTTIQLVGDDQNKPYSLWELFPDIPGLLLDETLLDAAAKSSPECLAQTPFAFPGQLYVKEEFGKDLAQ